jgi:hypothetical protein
VRGAAPAKPIRWPGVPRLAARMLRLPARLECHFHQALRFALSANDLKVCAPNFGQGEAQTHRLRSPAGFAKIALVRSRPQCRANKKSPPSPNLQAEKPRPNAAKLAAIMLLISGAWFHNIEPARDGSRCSSCLARKTGKSTFHAVMGRQRYSPVFSATEFDEAGQIHDVTHWGRVRLAPTTKARLE